MSGQDWRPARETGHSQVPSMHPLGLASSHGTFLPSTNVTSAHGNQNARYIVHGSHQAETHHQSAVPNANTYLNQFRASSIPTRAPRSASPHLDSHRNQVQGAGTHVRSSPAEGEIDVVPNARVISGGYVAQESAARFVSSSSSGPRLHHRDSIWIQTSTRHAPRLHPTESQSEPGQDIDYVAPSLRTTAHSSANFLVAVFPQPVNLVRRYAPHSVRLNVEFTNEDDLVARSISVNFTNSIAFSPPSFDPNLSRPAPLHTTDGPHIVRSSNEARRGGMLFRINDLSDLPTISDHTEESDSEDEVFYTPRTSPRATQDSAFIPEATVHHSPAPHSPPAPYPPPATFVSSPSLRLVRSPHTAHSMAYSGPYIPNYPSRPSSSIRRPMSNAAVRTNWRNAVLAPSPASLSSSSHSSTPRTSDTAAQRQPYPTIQFTIASVGTLNNIHHNPD